MKLRGGNLSTAEKFHVIISRLLSEEKSSKKRRERFNAKIYSEYIRHLDSGVNNISKIENVRFVPDEEKVGYHTYRMGSFSCQKSDEHSSNTGTDILTLSIAHLFPAGSFRVLKTLQKPNILENPTENPQNSSSEKASHSFFTA